jgi:hypothetical protein
MGILVNTVQDARAAYMHPAPSRAALDSLLAAHPLGPVLGASLNAVQRIIAQLQDQLRSASPLEFPEQVRFVQCEPKAW